MRNFTEKIAMRLSPEICEWLDQKAAQGFNKGAVIRLVLSEYMRIEGKERRQEPWDGAGHDKA